MYKQVNRRLTHHSNSKKWGLRHHPKIFFGRGVFTLGSPKCREGGTRLFILKRVPGKKLP